MYECIIKYTHTHTHTHIHSHILMFINHYLFPAVPGPVTNLSIMLDDEGNALITWLPPRVSPSSELDYNITYQVIGIGDCNDTYRGPVQMVDVAAAARSVTLTRLIPWRKYKLTIITVNRGRIGEIVERIFNSKETGQLDGLTKTTKSPYVIT